MLRTFLNNDYAVEWRVINAAEYCFPQKRRRVFIFAYHKSTKYYEKMSKISDEHLISTMRGFLLKISQLKIQNWILAALKFIRMFLKM